MVIPWRCRRGAEAREIWRLVLTAKDPMGCVSAV